MISRRASYASEPNALTLARARKTGPIVDLTVSNPTAIGLTYDPEIARALADPRALVYEPESLGLRAAREFIARREGTTHDRVMLTASTSEAYSLIVKLLCNPGDAVLVPQPSYPLFGPLATFEGVRTIPYSLRYDGAWHVDLSTLSAGARALFCVSPNNPTGSILRQEEIERMAELGVPLIVDEVFWDYRFAPRERARTDRVPTLRLGGLSKSCALPQLKLAWTIAEGPGAGELMRGLEWLSDAYLSTSTPVQHALPRLFELAPTAQLRARVTENLALLRARLAGSALTVLEVEAGWYACVRLPNTRSEEQWALDLLEAGLFVHPGHFFDFDFEPVIVLSLIAPTAPFARGMDILSSAHET